MTRNANITLILEKTFEDHNEKKKLKLKNKNGEASFLAVLKQ